MDLTVLAAMRARAAALIPYRRNPRPVGPASFPPFVEQELQRAATATSSLVQVVKDLDERLTALGG